jgi:hypothetical protein
VSIAGGWRRDSLQVRYVCDRVSGVWMATGDQLGRRDSLQVGCRNGGVTRCKVRCVDGDGACSGRQASAKVWRRDSLVCGWVTSGGTGRECVDQVSGACVDGGWGMRWVCGWQRNSVDYVFFWGL